MEAEVQIRDIHTLARNSLLIHVSMDYIIYSITNKMRILDTSTSRSNLNDTAGSNIMEQIKIEDPYFIPKSPIFHIETSAADLLTPEGHFIEDEYNTGNLSRNLFVLINSFPRRTHPLQMLENTKLYMDHTSALFIQTLLSSVLLYPDKFLALRNLDTNSKLEIIKDSIRGKYIGISNAESQSLTDFVLHVIETLERNPEETGIMPLLADLDKEGIHSWLRLSNFVRITDVQKFTNTVDLFHRLSNTMKPELISGIPRHLAKEISASATDRCVNDLIRVIIDVQFMEKILDIWKLLLESDIKSPDIISYLTDEIPRLFEYFEASKPLPGVEEHADISRVIVKNYLDTFLNAGLLSKLSELSNLPSSELLLKQLRCLKTDLQDNLPVKSIVNFLFTATFILQEHPTLSVFHQRSEEYDSGWVDSAHQSDPKSPRWILSPRIFPGIIFRDESVDLPETVPLEIRYNKLKNSISDLDLRIGQVGQLNKILREARGTPL
jgi:hypothetical protein